MDSANRVLQAVQVALQALLHPLVRLLLRYQVPFSVFEELARRAYVRVAMEDFALPGRKPTVSRASILTGLTRKEVQRLLAEPPHTVGQDGYNRAARVVSAWTRDADFQDASGGPAALSISEGPLGFAELVRRHSGDMPARAVLDELLAVAAVQLGSDGRLRLAQRAYVPRAGETEKLGILGNDVADLIATIDHNLQHGVTDARFQRKVMYRSFPADSAPAFRELSARQAQKLLERLDAWLAEHDLDNPPHRSDAPRLRLGLGIQYFEAPAAPEPARKE